MSKSVSGEKLRFGKIVLYAGAVLAFFIGAGFATGQEILMYYVSYGSKLFIVAGIVFVILLWSSLSFAFAGANYKFENNSEVFQFFCGKYAGAIYDYFSVIFCFVCYIFMVAGAGSALQQQFGIPNAVGAVFMGVLVVLTVSLGLQKITDILGRLGTVILVVILVSSIWNLLVNIDMVGPNLRAINTGGPEQFGMQKSIAANAVMNGANYMGTVIIWFITFVTMMATKSEYKREVKFGMLTGSILILLSIIVTSLAMTAIIGQVGSADAPNLIMAANIWKPLGVVFSVIVVLGIYTSAVPLLWTPVVRFTEDGSRKAKLLSALLGMAGVAIALFVPYKTLVNYIINFGGMMTYVLYFFIFFKDIQMFSGYQKKKKEQACVKKSPQ